MVNKKWLMIANALLWMAAGFNILRGITLRHIGAVPEAFFPSSTLDSEVPCSPQEQNHLFQ